MVYFRSRSKDVVNIFILLLLFKYFRLDLGRVRNDSKKLDHRRFFIYLISLSYVMKNIVNHIEPNILQIRIVAYNVV